ERTQACNGRCERVPQGGPTCKKQAVVHSLQNFGDKNLEGSGGLSTLRNENRPLRACSGSLRSAREIPYGPRTAGPDSDRTSQVAGSGVTVFHSLSVTPIYTHQGAKNSIIPNPV